MLLRAGAVALATIVGFFAYTGFQYRPDIKEAYERVESIESRVIETDCGPVEYAESGDGDPVLVIHGIFGGFDQGLLLGKGQVGKGFRLIAPSRFGYMGTPMPEDPSPAKQADAFACLLNSLDIEKAGVVSTSAGSTSAVQFALRYPDRCSGMVFISPNAPGEVNVGLPPKPLANTLFKSDYLFWFMTEYFNSTVRSMMGVPKDFELTPEYRAEIDRTVETVLPVSPRADGGIFDMFTSNQAINNYDLEEISVPSLFVGAEDDPLAAYHNTKNMAKIIPGAKLVTLKEGGHILLGHSAGVGEEIRVFLRDNLDGHSLT